MSPTQQARQVLLDLLGEYRKMNTPANPDLLKLHIDAATDKLEGIYATDVQPSGQATGERNASQRASKP